MPVYQTFDAIPLLPRAVVTIGTFDGVHLGHRKVIAQLLQEAEAIGGTPVLVTFYPHPKRVVSHDRKPVFLLNTAREKYNLLHEAGIEHIVEVPFNRAFSSQSAMGYIRDFLVGKLHVHTIIIGYDHRFGHNREGDYRLLESMAPDYGYTVREIPEQLLQDVVVSSTRIREALQEGRLEDAQSLLGYPYFFSGLVVEGNKLGRTIGFPTANLLMEDPEKLVPASGVYVVDVWSDKYEQTYRGMMNIGVRPTVDGTRKMIEVHLLDFDKDLYNSKLSVTLRSWIREEKKFEGLEALKRQLEADREVARQLA